MVKFSLLIFLFLLGLLGSLSPMFPISNYKTISIGLNPYTRSDIIVIESGGYNIGQNTSDFLYPAYTLDASLKLEVPLSIIANQLTLADTNVVEVNQNNEVEIDKIFLTKHFVDVLIVREGGPVIVIRDCFF